MKSEVPSTAGEANGHLTLLRSAARLTDQM
jgi:hypothetical protein